MLPQDQQNLINYLSEFLTEERQQKIETVLAQRTRYLTVILEDIHRTHNASAVLRNCEAFGIQDIHAIEKRNPFEIHREITRGCHKWLTVYRYNDIEQNNTLNCLNTLKSAGYKIVATTPHETGISLQDLKLDRKLALMFGSELEGLSQEALQQADEYVTIPMVGYSESLNLSVTVALCLYDLTHRLRCSDIDWSLTKSEISQLRLQWMRKAIPHSLHLERHFFENLNKPK
jgi:tRNA (guanosine-2'-O-)-methyltransferase